MIERLESAAAFLVNEATRRPVAPEPRRPDAERIPRSLRQKWLADADGLRQLADALRDWPKNLHALALLMGSPDRGPKTRYVLGSLTDVGPVVPRWDFWDDEEVE